MEIRQDPLTISVDILGLIRKVVFDYVAIKIEVDIGISMRGPNRHATNVGIDEEILLVDRVDIEQEAHFINMDSDLVFDPKSVAEEIICAQVKGGLIRG